MGLAGQTNSGQKSQIKIPGQKAQYSLTVVVIYEKLSKRLSHYSAFIRSAKDKMKWFYVNDSRVSLIYTEY